jgi:hypothetical protein
VKVPGSTGFTAVTPGTVLPIGTIVDVSHGAGIVLADAAGKGMTFFGDKDSVLSQFQISGRVNAFRSGPAAVAAVTRVLRLVGGNFSKCGKRSTSGLSASTAAAKPVRRLWGKGTGRYQTRGRYSSATVRGTWWLTADFCDGTRTTVRQGVVAVRDFRKKKTVVLTAGKSYNTAAKPKPKPKPKKK